MPKHHKIKILHILNSFGLGGLENGVVNLINNMNPRAFQHEICCVRHSGEAEGRLKRKVAVVELRKREGNDWSTIPKLIRVIHRSGAAIVHTRNWGTVDGIIAARLARVSIVIHGEHGWNMDDPRGKNPRRRVARRILSAGVDRFIAVSEDIRQWLNQDIGIKLRKIVKIVNGVDTKLFCPSTDYGLKQEFGLKDRVVIGTVGRLDPIKRQDLLIEGFSRLDDKAGQISLVIIGDGPERKRLEELRGRLRCSKNILFLGQRSDVFRLYHLMDIFVLPSVNEGMSNTILEAMACGIPVIATNVGGNRELVTHNRTGLLVEPNSPKSIREALNYYLQNPGLREIHGKNARLEAEARFSIDQMVRKYEKLYMDLAIDRRPRGR